MLELILKKKVDLDDFIEQEFKNMKKPAQNFENDENDEINDPPPAAKKPTLKVSQIKQKP